MYDYIVVGAGFSGAVVAERLASVRNKKILVIEKRNHIGGNAYDRYNEKGLLVHQYGPHIFHTRLKGVWDYLCQFTKWHLYHHYVLASIDGQKVPIPFNLKSLRMLFPSTLAQRLEEKLLAHFGYNVKIPIIKLREIDDPDIKFLADFIYEKVFLNYTLKQWGMKPEDLDPTVTGRVPIYISMDCRYFQDPYQGIPQEGYTALFNNMLSHPNINILLNTDYKQVVDVDLDTGKIKVFGNDFDGKLIYTGKLDEFFNYEFGELPYRSLKFDFVTIEKEEYQEVATVNYPNEYSFTRITEFKKMTGQQHTHTTIVKEYPQEYSRFEKSKDIPYYPVATSANLELYLSYKKKADTLKNMYFIGRLAEYKYFDMDAAIARALNLFNVLGE